MIRLSEIRLPLSAAENPEPALIQSAATVLGIQPADMARLTVFKRSFDARKRELLAVYIVDLELADRAQERALLARELGIRHVDTVCISSYDHDNQREMNIIKRAEGDGDGFIVIDDLVDTGGTAKAIRDMYPKAHFVTIFAKPAGKPLVDDYVVDIPQDTWIEQPWDMGITFVKPIGDN